MNGIKATVENRLLRAQQRFARLAVAAIVACALLLTYEGTVRFAQAHGALGWRGWLIAAMNDLAVLVGILWPEKPLQGLAALCSGLTIWANFDHAAPGVAGAVVALVPPVLAIAMVAALEIVLRSAAHEPVVSQQATHAEPNEPPAEPVSQDRESEAAHEPDREPLHLVPEPMEWTRESVLQWIREEGATTAQAVAHTGVSKATVNRWKREVA